MADDELSTTSRRALGLAMVGLLVAVLGLCVAVYNKAFTPTVRVTTVISQVDNSFVPQDEVRLRGVDVGMVNSARSDGRHAILTLDLQPSQAKFIPRNVTVRILPKSLFGERFVGLMLPPNPSPQAIQDGDVIPPNRSGDTIEVDQVFNNLLPLLLAVRPADLATTLGALNQALAGRGAELGDTISRLHDYLSRFNPSLPDLTQDIQKLPKFSDTYTKAAPNLIEGLTNLTTTSHTLVDKRDAFERLFSTLTGTSNDLRDFLDDNGDTIVRLAETARPTLDLLKLYSPEVVCFFGQLSDDVPRLNRAFGKGEARPELHITAEIVANRGPYRPHQDEPDFTDTRGPRCYNPTPPFPQYPGGAPQDGASHPPVSQQQSRLGEATGTAPTTARGLGQEHSNRNTLRVPLLGDGTTGLFTGSGPGSAGPAHPLSVPSPSRGNR